MVTTAKRVVKIIDIMRFDDIPDLIDDGIHGNRIIWKRDGSHSPDDLQIILEFEKAGFQYKIYNYEGEFEKKAIKIEFIYKK